MKFKYTNKTANMNKWWYYFCSTSPRQYNGY